jgi:signal transduction histidine kinase
MDGAPNEDRTGPTEPATAEQELQQALSFLGHDARAGHSSTLALLDLQRIQSDPGSVAQLLARIEANARRSLAAIDDFADLIRARRQVLRLEPFELTDLLIDVVAEAWTAANQNGVRILITPGPASVVVRADRGLVESALGKLLRDAVGASAAGSEISCSMSIEPREQVNDGVIEIAEAAPAAVDTRVAAPRASRKVASSLSFAQGVAGRHGGQVSQSVSEGGRRTRFALRMEDVSDSTSS